MNRLLIATKNKAKLRELSQLLSDLPLKLLSLEDVGITDDVEETGKTYRENSQKKALFYAKKSGLPVIADDGGLEIAAFDGAPGVHSKRWLGQRAGEKEIIAHMMKVSRALPDNNREASFKTVLSFAASPRKVWQAKGEVKGIIPKKPFFRLIKGYPYRSFFYLPKIKKYYHEKDLSENEMKLYNHRKKALKKLLPIITRELKLQK